MKRDIWLIITNDFGGFGYEVEKFLSEESAREKYREIAEQEIKLVVLAKVLEGKIQ